MKTPKPRPLAVVTGASSGIGFELAREFVENGFDLIIAAEDEGIHDAREALEDLGGLVEAVQVDLSTFSGVEELYERIRSASRPLEAIALNAGVGVGGEFARQTSLEEELKLIQLNVLSVVHLAKRVSQDLVRQKRGKMLFTSSIASFLPSPYEAVYGASKAFVQSFAESLRTELADVGVTVTALLPGPTETNFFHRAGMDDTRVGRDQKDDPAKVAHQGFKAMMAGHEKVFAGAPKNKIYALAGRLLPERVKSALHRRMSEPDELPAD